MIAHLWTTWFTDYFKSAIEIYCLGKRKKNKIAFKISPLIDNAPGHPRALTEMYSEINFAFMPADTTFILYIPVHFFRHNATLCLIDYNINITFIWPGKPKNSHDSLYCSSLEPNPQYLQGMPVYKLC